MLSRIAALALLAAPVPAQCPTWAPGFGPAGTSGEVHDLAVFDDGAGPAVFLAGHFAAAGDVVVSGLARWDASGWAAPIPGPSFAFGEEVQRLRVVDLGAGPVLLALGSFLSVAGQPARGVAAFDGQQWSALAGGPPVTAPFTKLTLAAAVVFDAGSGPRLYVGGTVVDAESDSARKPYLATWDGATWTVVTNGPQEYEHCGFECNPNGAIGGLEVLEEAGSPALYASGAFRLPGLTATFRLARFDGATWSPPGGAALGSQLLQIWGMTPHNDGSGPALYLAGQFGPGAPHHRLVRWDGQTLDAPVQGLVGDVSHLRWLPAAAGHPAGLWAMWTQQPLNLQRWDGAQWVQQPAAVQGRGNVLGAFDAGDGPQIFLAGAFQAAGGQVAANVASFDGASWSALAQGLGWSSDSSGPGFVSALAVHDDGNGPALYAGGEFTHSDGGTFANLARWGGSGWQPVPGFTLPALHHVEDLLSLDVGQGPLLWLAGDLKVGFLNPVAIATWDGQTLSAVQTTMSSEAFAIVAFDDGSGARPYASFGPSVRRWDGGSGFVVIGATSAGKVSALVVHDDGGGEALYAAGTFQLFGGAAAARIARWDGATWSAVGGGFGNGSVEALCVFDDGHGPKLYAGGSFTTAGGAPANRVAVWDGQAWAALGGGIAGANATVLALAAFDAGDLGGRDLYAGGRFASAGGSPAANLARWDGAGWGGAGLETTGPTVGVRALLASDLPAAGGRALSVGGDFEAIGGVTAVRYARLGACPELGEIFCLGDGTQGDCPCANAGLPGHGCENSASIRGAELHASGSAEHDTVVLDVGFLPPTALAIFLQGDLVLGAPATFGDGLRCIGGSLKRLYVENAVAGLASAPGAGDPSIQERSAALGDPLQPGSVRGYQVYYRDPSPTFCPEPQGSTFNISNGMLLVW